MAPGVSWAIGAPRACLQHMVALVHDPHSTARTDERPVAAARAAVAPATLPGRPARARPQDDAERDAVDRPDRCALAGFARSLWEMADRVQPLSPVAGGRALGSHPRGSPARRGRRRRTGRRL